MTASAITVHFGPSPPTIDMITVSSCAARPASTRMCTMAQKGGGNSCVPLEKILWQVGGVRAGGGRRGSGPYLRGPLRRARRLLRGRRRVGLRGVARLLDGCSGLSCAGGGPALGGRGGAARGGHRAGGARHRTLAGYLLTLRPARPAAALSARRRPRDTARRRSRNTGRNTSWNDVACARAARAPGVGRAATAGREVVLGRRAVRG